VTEVWRDVVGYEGIYEVSNIGRIKTVKRVVTRTNGWDFTVKERILKPATDVYGYKRVSLSNMDKGKTHKVHRVVAQAFLKSIDGKNEVNHINGIKDDNRAENLEWCNRSENVEHAFKNGLSIPRRGSKVHTAKIDEWMALTIKTLLGAGYGPAKVSRMCDVSRNICKDINRGRTWNHIKIL
jgi:hypothetical protein